MIARQESDSGGDGADEHPVAHHGYLHAPQDSGVRQKAD